MTRVRQQRQRGLPSAAVDLDTELLRIAAISIDALRSLWRHRRGRDAPSALSKDLIARAVAHWLQEEQLRRLDLRVRKLLATMAKNGALPVRHLKVGSVIVREHQGKVYE